MFALLFSILSICKGQDGNATNTSDAELLFAAPLAASLTTLGTDAGDWAPRDNWDFPSDDQGGPLPFVLASPKDASQVSMVLLNRLQLAYAAALSYDDSAGSSGSLLPTFLQKWLSGLLSNLDTSAVWANAAVAAALKAAAGALNNMVVDIGFTGQSIQVFVPATAGATIGDVAECVAAKLNGKASDFVILAANVQQRGTLTTATPYIKYTACQEDWLLSDFDLSQRLKLIPRLEGTAPTLKQRPLSFFGVKPTELSAPQGEALAPRIIWQHVGTWHGSTLEQASYQRARPNDNLWHRLLGKVRLIQRIDNENFMVEHEQSHNDSHAGEFLSGLPSLQRVPVLCVDCKFYSTTAKQKTMTEAELK
eukprot:5276927-Pleurochrysis_carterae.AAC.1